MNEEEYLELVNDPSSRNLKKIPLEHRTERVCVAAVNAYSRNLKFVPDSIKSKDMCWDAVKSNPYNIKYVPDQIMDRKLAKLAWSKAPGTKIYINNPYFRGEENEEHTVLER